MNTPQQVLEMKAVDLQRRAEELERERGKDAPFALQLRQQAFDLLRRASMPNLEDLPPNPVRFHAGTRG
jgi:hypothetical protein